MTPILVLWLAKAAESLIEIKVAVFNDVIPVIMKPEAVVWRPNVVVFEELLILLIVVMFVATMDDTVFTVKGIWKPAMGECPDVLETVTNLTNTYFIIAQVSGLLTADHCWLLMSETE